MAKKKTTTFSKFVKKHPARIAAWVSATVALVVSFVAPDVPSEAAITFVLATLGLGEYAQRVENHKTQEALATDPNESLE